MLFQLGSRMLAGAFDQPFKKEKGDCVSYCRAVVLNSSVITLLLNVPIKWKNVETFEGGFLDQ